MARVIVRFESLLQILQDCAHSYFKFSYAVILTVTYLMKSYCKTSSNNESRRLATWENIRNHIKYVRETISHEYLSELPTLPCYQRRKSVLTNEIDCCLFSIARRNCVLEIEPTSEACDRQRMLQTFIPSSSKLVDFTDDSLQCYQLARDLLLCPSFDYCHCNPDLTVTDTSNWRELFSTRKKIRFMEGSTCW